MDPPNVQTTSEQLVIANIYDFLKDKVGLTEYHQRKHLCQTLLANTPHQTQAQPSEISAQMMAASQALATNSQTEDGDLTAVKSRWFTRKTWQEEAMSPASMSSIDSAYSSSTPPSPPSYETSYIGNLQDDVNERFDNVKSRTESLAYSRDHKPSLTDFSKGQSRNNPTVQTPNNKRIRAKRAAADIDESQPESPKKRRNRGPKPRIMYEGNGPIQLWQLILKLLVESPSSEFDSDLVEWTREQKYGFRIREPNKLAELWGRVKKKPAMNFEKLARSLRYYYGKSMLEKVHGQENTYQFVWDISELLGYDPVDGCPVADSKTGSLVSESKDGLPVADQKGGFAVSDLVDRSPVSEPKNVLPISDSTNGLPVDLVHGLPVFEPVYRTPVSDSASSIPVSDSMYGLSVSKPAYGTPVSDPTCSIPVSNPVYGFPVSDSLYGLPVSDPLYVPVSNPVGGFPVSQSGGGFPVPDFVYPGPQVVPIPPLDFAMLVESDEKCSFYEAL